MSNADELMQELIRLGLRQIERMPEGERVQMRNELIESIRAQLGAAVAQGAEIDVVSFEELAGPVPGTEAFARMEQSVGGDRLLARRRGIPAGMMPDAAREFEANLLALLSVREPNRAYPAVLAVVAALSNALVSGRVDDLELVSRWESLRRYVTSGPGGYAVQVRPGPRRSWGSQLMFTTVSSPTLPGAPAARFVSVGQQALSLLPGLGSVPATQRFRLSYFGSGFGRAFLELAFPGWLGGLSAEVELWAPPPQTLDDVRVPPYTLALGGRLPSEGRPALRREEAIRQFTREGTPADGMLTGVIERAGIGPSLWPYWMVTQGGASTMALLRGSGRSTRLLPPRLREVVARMWPALNAFRAQRDAVLELSGSMDAVMAGIELAFEALVLPSVFLMDIFFGSGATLDQRVSAASNLLGYFGFVYLARLRFSIVRRRERPDAPPPALNEVIPILRYLARLYYGAVLMGSVGADLLFSMLARELAGADGAASARLEIIEQLTGDEAVLGTSVAAGSLRIVAAIGAALPNGRIVELRDRVQLIAVADELALGLALDDEGQPDTDYLAVYEVASSSLSQLQGVTSFSPFDAQRRAAAAAIRRAGLNLLSQRDEDRTARDVLALATVLPTMARDSDIVDQVLVQDLASNLVTELRRAGSFVDVSHRRMTGETGVHLGAASIAQTFATIGTETDGGVVLIGGDQAVRFETAVFAPGRNRAARLVLEMLEANVPGVHVEGSPFEQGTRNQPRLALSRPGQVENILDNGTLALDVAERVLMGRSRFSDPFPVALTTGPWVDPSIRPRPVVPVEATAEGGNVRRGLLDLTNTAPVLPGRSGPESRGGASVATLWSSAAVALYLEGLDDRALEHLARLAAAEREGDMESDVAGTGLLVQQTWRSGYRLSSRFAEMLRGSGLGPSRALIARCIVAGSLEQYFAFWDIVRRQMTTVLRSGNPRDLARYLGGLRAPEGFIVQALTQGGNHAERRASVAEFLGVLQSMRDLIANPGGEDYHSPQEGLIAGRRLEIREMPGAGSKRQRTEELPPRTDPDLSLYRRRLTPQRPGVEARQVTRSLYALQRAVRRFQRRELVEEVEPAAIIRPDPDPGVGFQLEGRRLLQELDDPAVYQALRDREEELYPTAPAYAPYDDPLEEDPYGSDAEEEGARMRIRVRVHVEGPARSDAEILAAREAENAAFRREDEEAQLVEAQRQMRVLLAAGETDPGALDNYSRREARTFYTGMLRYYERLSPEEQQYRWERSPALRLHVTLAREYLAVDADQRRRAQEAETARREAAERVRDETDPEALRLALARSQMWIPRVVVEESSDTDDEVRLQREVPPAAPPQVPQVILGPAANDELVEVAAARMRQVANQVEADRQLALELNEAEVLITEEEKEAQEAILASFGREEEDVRRTSVSPVPVLLEDPLLIARRRIDEASVPRLPLPPATPRGFNSDYFGDDADDIFPSPSPSAAREPVTRAPSNAQGSAAAARALDLIREASAKATEREVEEKEDCCGPLWRQVLAPLYSLLEKNLDPEDLRAYRGILGMAQAQYGGELPPEARPGRRAREDKDLVSAVAALLHFRLTPGAGAEEAWAELLDGISRREDHRAASPPPAREASPASSAPAPDVAPSLPVSVKSSFSARALRTYQRDTQGIRVLGALVAAAPAQYGPDLREALRTAFEILEGHIELFTKAQVDGIAAELDRVDQIIAHRINREREAWEAAEKTELGRRLHAQEIGRSMQWADEELGTKLQDITLLMLEEMVGGSDQGTTGIIARALERVMALVVREGTRYQLTSYLLTAAERTFRRLLQEERNELTARQARDVLLAYAQVVTRHIPTAELRVDLTNAGPEVLSPNLFQRLVELLAQLSEGIVAVALGNQENPLPVPGPVSRALHSQVAVWGRRLRERTVGDRVIDWLFSVFASTYPVVGDMGMLNAASPQIVAKVWGTPDGLNDYALREILAGMAPFDEAAIIVGLWFGPERSSLLPMLLRGIARQDFGPGTDLTTHLLPSVDNEPVILTMLQDALERFASLGRSSRTASSATQIYWSRVREIFVECVTEAMSLGREVPTPVTLLRLLLAVAGVGVPEYGRRVPLDTALMVRIALGLQRLTPADTAGGRAQISTPTPTGGTEIQAVNFLVNTATNSANMYWTWDDERPAGAVVYPAPPPAPAPPQTFVAGPPAALPPPPPYSPPAGASLPASAGPPRAPSSPKRYPARNRRPDAPVRRNNGIAVPASLMALSNLTAALPMSPELEELDAALAQALKIMVRAGSVYEAGTNAELQQALEAIARANMRWMSAAAAARISRSAQEDPQRLLLLLREGTYLSLPDAEWTAAREAKTVIERAKQRGVPVLPAARVADWPK